jgi:hypothetical protein
MTKIDLVLLPTTAQATQLGNNAAWRCACGDTLLGSTMIARVVTCSCGRVYELDVADGAKPGSIPIRVRQTR